MKLLQIAPLVGLCLLSACSKPEAKDTAPPAPESQKSPREPATVDDEKRPSANEKGEKTAEPASAEVGKPAPDFSLPNLQGEDVALSAFRGKIVVLEWFNPGCPFVRAAHTKGSLVDTAAQLSKKGVVYLAINSGAPGKQGHGQKTNEEAKKLFDLDHPILMDESGRVGKQYGATNTPHIFVIDDKGLLAYAGAVDNSPDGEGKSPKDGKLVNYLTSAVDQLLAQKPVSVPETKAYGCSVKYGD